MHNLTCRTILFTVDIIHYYLFKHLNILLSYKEISIYFRLIYRYYF